MVIKGILTNKGGKDFDASSKMEHADLLAEMHTIENLPTQERLHLARMRRAQQLKVARQKEKEWAKLQRNQTKQSHGNAHSKHRINHSTSSSSSASAARRHISFENSVVLLEAASRNDIQEVANLLQRGITPDAANEDGLTALHQCCIDNNIEMLKLLLDYGANVDAQDSDKWTPLHAAATCGHLNLVKILIGRGANLLAVNTDGNMPYDLCDDEDTLDYIEAEMSKRGVTQELIDETRAQTEKQMLEDLIQKSMNGGDLEEPDHQSATPLHIASANGYTRVVEFLLEHHVNVDAVDKDLWSAVHAAACWGHMEVLELLAQYGADLYAKNKDDETPADICEDPEIRERIELLKTEQESKRLAEQQRRRVRRSQSNNTRAQSVRRTSLRDKTLTTKKDAVEETRLRLQAQEVFTAPDSTTEPKSLGTESMLSQKSTAASVATSSTTLLSGAASTSSLSGPNSLPSTIPNNNQFSKTATTNNSGRRKSATSLGGATDVTSTQSEIDGNLNGNLRSSNSSGNLKTTSMGNPISATSNNNSASSGNLRKNSFSQTTHNHQHQHLHHHHRSDNSINNNSSSLTNGFTQTSNTANLHHNYNNNSSNSNSREIISNGSIGNGLSETNLNRNLQQQQANKLTSQQDNVYQHPNTMMMMPNQQHHHSFNRDIHQQQHPSYQVNATTHTTNNSISRRPPEGKDNEEFPLRDKLHSSGEHATRLGSSSNAGTGSKLLPTGNNTLGALGSAANMNVHKMNSTTPTNNGIVATTATSSAVADRSTAEIFQATKENGKINVQVTVLVDTHNLDNALNQSGATLANLKKQRAQSRTTALPENGVAPGYVTAPAIQQQQQQSTSHYNNIQTTSAATMNNATMLNGLHSNTNMLNNKNEFLLTPNLDSTTANAAAAASLLNSTASSPTSPIDLNQIHVQQQPLSPNVQQTNNISKFSGITGDVVSDSTGSKKCCILM